MSCELCRVRTRNDKAQLEFNLARDAKNNNKSFGQKMKIKNIYLMNRLWDLMTIDVAKADILYNIFYLLQNIFSIFCFQGCYLFPHLKFLNIKVGTGQQASSDLRPVSLLSMHKCIPKS